MKKPWWKRTTLEFVIITITFGGVGSFVPLVAWSEARDFRFFPTIHSLSVAPMVKRLAPKSSTPFGIQPDGSWATCVIEKDCTCHVERGPR